MEIPYIIIELQVRIQQELDAGNIGTAKALQVILDEEIAKLLVPTA